MASENLYPICKFYENAYGKALTYWIYMKCVLVGEKVKLYDLAAQTHTVWENLLQRIDVNGS